MSWLVQGSSSGSAELGKLAGAKQSSLLGQALAHVEAPIGEFALSGKSSLSHVSIEENTAPQIIVPEPSNPVEIAISRPPVRSELPHVSPVAKVKDHPKESTKVSDSAQDSQAGRTAASITTSQLIGAVKSLAARLEIPMTLDAGSSSTNTLTVLERLIKPLVKQDLSNEIREELFNVRQALKRVAKTSENGDIPLLMRRLEPLIGEAFFKRKLDENIKILEQQMTRIQELAKLRQQLNEL